MGIDHSNPYIHSTTVLCDTDDDATESPCNGATVQRAMVHYNAHKEDIEREWEKNYKIILLLYRGSLLTLMC